MTRYHVNLETGDPGVCKASDSCRFGDEAHHYASESIARTAYEESMVDQEFKKISFKAGEIEVDALSEDCLISSHEATVPAGRYFVGDPCYSAGHDHEAWDKWISLADAMSHGFTDPVAGATYNGYPVVALNTLYGDGSYAATNGSVYLVDAGMIGVVPEELIEKMGLAKDELSKLGSWEEFDEPVKLSYSDNGTLTIGSIVIATGDDAAEEEAS